MNSSSYYEIPLVAKQCQQLEVLIGSRGKWRHPAWCLVSGHTERHGGKITEEGVGEGYGASGDLFTLPQNHRRSKLWGFLGKRKEANQGVGEGFAPVKPNGGFPSVFMPQKRQGIAFP